ncbi:AAA family ATPase, partial [Patulibacter medicamentivorans]|uniref:AAA family ATPase n=1 Tax=Patulibacter medicamentivorans TaxID=1097667 RepID=UPI0005918181
MTASGPTLLGREADLATVDRALDEMLGQVVGRLIVIEGPAGAGATSLLDAICARAAARSVPVARATGDERSRTVPFAVAVGLFAGHLQAAGPGRRGALLADRAALATPLFGPDGWSPPDDHDGGGLVEGLYWLAGQIARSDPGRRAPGLLIAVDDAHWCDHATLRLLARLTLRIEQLPLVVAIAAREGAPSDDDLLERLRGHPRAEILRPAPHDAAAIATLVGARLGRAGDPELVRACLQATGGNPFLVEEFLAALAVDGVPRGAVGALAAGGGAVAGASERAVAIRLEAVGAAGR